MKAAKFHRIVEQVPDLNHVQRVQLRDRLDHSDDLKTVCDLIEKRIEVNPACPRCGSQHIVKHGFRNNLIRYRCKECTKTFNALTGTALAGLHKKELWLNYSTCLLESQSIRKAATVTGISTTTSFTWRHRMLSLSQTTEKQLLSGIVEADETFFLESQKGSRHLTRPARKRGGSAKKRGLSRELVSVLVACDRNGNEADYITGFGAVGSRWLELNFTVHLDSQALLVTDSAKSFCSFCKNKNIAHISINLSQGIRSKGIFHVQHVNSYHRTLKTWMIRFHGVATKYLNHYLGWCNELFNRNINTPLRLIELAFEPKTPLSQT